MAQHNLGFFTASTISPIMTGKGDKLLKGGVEHSKRIALERLGIELEDSFTGNIATEFGNMYEHEAIITFENCNMVEVKDTQKQITKGWLSCTPDGYIGEDELIEVKCPYNPLNHLNNIMSDTFLESYYDQVQFQLMLSERQRCYLVSYSPKFPKGVNLYSKVIEKNEEWADKCRSRLEQAEAVIQEVFAVFKIIGEV